MSDPGSLSQIFKAYDVRGLVPSQLDESLARSIGAAFALEVGAPAGAGEVVVGHDMRASSPSLATAFGEGVMDRGVDVLQIGLASTDLLYFASGHLDLPGAMFTASHNPAAYNGIKLCRAGAVALSAETGLDAIRREVETAARRDAHQRGLPPPGGRGSARSRELLGAYADYLHQLVPVTGRRLTVVVDAGNGMAGLTAPAVLSGLDLELVPLYFDLDGSFPHHEANPLEPANVVDLQRAVADAGADIGLAFDGDADRCFVIDEQGRAVSASALTALIAVRELAREPGGHVIHNVVTSRAVAEIVAEHGGVPVRTRVGHSLIKATMAEHRAVFGGEHSGHFYFRDFWYADSGMLAALHVLAQLASSVHPLSELMSGFDRYVASGELNTTVADPVAVVDALAAHFARDDRLRLDRLDGLSVMGEDWSFNVRPSNTEPTLRLNVEGESAETMTQVRDQVKSLMRRYS
ncbi:MAG: phosphomannomutase/phosphoglucomutase [Nocardioidaceae bacterium]